MQHICEANACTACGACQNVCPKDCISFEYDEYDVKRAYIDLEKCVSCKLCYSTCPQNAKIPGKISSCCYAAWSLDEKIRSNSASGGVAAELYRYAVDNGYWISGVSMDDECNAVYSLTDKFSPEFQNSKYTFSNMGNLYWNVSSKLKENEKVLFIGLPCQVAALKAFLSVKNIDETNIVFVDLICHGVTSELYLIQHIKQIEIKKGARSTEVRFRDPKYGSHAYYFTLANHNMVFYKKSVKQDDEYQIAYHRGIAYRENCYACQWAGRERLGDITLSDFPGLGSKEKCPYNSRSVSCVMTNTLKGNEIYSKLLQQNRIYSEIRPLEENLEVQPTLNHPTPRPPEREVFLARYRNSKDFDKSIQEAAHKIIRSNRFNSLTRYRDIKLSILKLIPRAFKDQVKRVINRAI